ncbi:hypothetical protein GGF46_004221 [Coemansia sp. RSA 552]|nr:hypothetical protein GGF46_004221 [Coemansia sp. RSA 552]
MLNPGDIDALFKSVRISLHVPDGAVRFSEAADSSDADTRECSARNVIDGPPPRRVLYRGEKAAAFLVATLPNFDQVRWSLATAMRRRAAPELGSGDLPISQAEAEQFFALLGFTVAGFQAKTVPASNPASSQTSPAAAVAQSRPPPQITGNQSKVAGVASTPSFVTQTPGEESRGNLPSVVDKLGTGAWCCVYPFTVDVPLAASSDVLDAHMEMALMLEIRAACRRPDAGPAAASADQQALRIDSGAIRLEELAMHISAGASAAPDPARNPALELVVEQATKDAEAQPALPPALQKVVQILVATRPMVDISARVIRMPANLGADAALVEVTVQYRLAASTELQVCNVQLQSPRWHVQPVSAQLIPSFPVPLVPGTTWSSAFRISSLAATAREDEFGGLKLLNSSGLADGSSTAADRGSDLLACVCIGANDGGPPLEISHRIAMPRPASHTAPALSDGATYVQSDTASEASMPAASLSSVRSGRSSDAFAHNPRITTELRRPFAKEGSVMGHSKTLSLDNTHKVPVQPRKYSLVQPPARLSMADAAPLQKPRPTSMLKPPDATRTGRAETIVVDQALLSPGGTKHGTLGLTASRRARARAMTVNAAAIYSHRRPQNSVSTVQSVSTRASHAPYEADPQDGAASTHQEPSIMDASLSDQAGLVVGAIDVAFEASPHAKLGEELWVRVYLSNNTSMAYDRLCLVSGDFDGADKSPSVCGLLPVTCATNVPQLLPGESAFATLKYVAAVPDFHTVGPLQLVDLAKSRTALATIEAPLVVFVDDAAC